QRVQRCEVLARLLVYNKKIVLASEDDDAQRAFRDVFVQRHTGVRHEEPERIPVLQGLSDRPPDGALSEDGGLCSASNRVCERSRIGVLFSRRRSRWAGVPTIPSVRASCSTP